MSTHKTAKTTRQPLPFHRRFWDARVDLLLGLIFILLTALYAVFMVTDRVPLWGWGLLGGLWLIYALTVGRLSYSTPLDLPILGLATLSLFSLLISVDRALSAPKVTGLILGIALFYLIVNAIRHYQALHLAIIGLITLAIATALLGLLGMDASGGRFSSKLEQVLNRFRKIGSKFQF